VVGFGDNDGTYCLLGQREGSVTSNETTFQVFKAAGEATRWKKGQSGNPKGSVPKSRVIQTFIANQTMDGRKIVNELWHIAQDRQVRVRDRIKAMEILLERGFGKPVQQVEVEGQVSLTRELGSFSDQELMELVDLRKKLLSDEEHTVEGESRIVPAN